MTDQTDQGSWLTQVIDFLHEVRDAQPGGSARDGIWREKAGKLLEAWALEAERDD